MDLLSNGHPALRGSLVRFVAPLYTTSLTLYWWDGAGLPMLPRPVNDIICDSDSGGQ